MTSMRSLRESTSLQRRLEILKRSLNEEREPLLAGVERKSEEKKEKVMEVIVVDETLTPPPSARGTLSLSDYTTLKRGVAKVSSAKG